MFSIYFYNFIFMMQIKVLMTYYLSHETHSITQNGQIFKPLMFLKHATSKRLKENKLKIVLYIDFHILVLSQLSIAIAHKITSKCVKSRAGLISFLNFQSHVDVLSQYLISYPPRIAVQFGPRIKSRLTLFRESCNINHPLMIAISRPVGWKV